MHPTESECSADLLTLVFQLGTDGTPRRDQQLANLTTFLLVPAHQTDHRSVPNTFYSPLSERAVGLSRLLRWIQVPVHATENVASSQFRLFRQRESLPWRGASEVCNHTASYDASLARHNDRISSTNGRVGGPCRSERAQASHRPGERC